MTNAERYLKDGTDGGEFVKKLVKKISHFDGCKYYSEEMEHETILFLEEQVKPVLTEDERVILRNVGKDYQRIERDDECLWVRGVDADGFMTTCYFKCYDHLFQFIKERRRI